MRWAISLLLVPSLLAAQGTTGGARDSLAALQSLFAEKGKTAIVTPDASMKFDTRIDKFSDCGVDVTLVFGERVTTYLIDLRRWSPEVSVKPVGMGTALYIVSIENTSGNSDVPTRVVSEGEIPDSARGLSSFVDEQSARRASVLWASAIRSCGGVPRSPEVKARREAANRAVTDSAERLRRGSLSDSAKVAIAALCRERVKRQLRAPSAAVFEPDSSWLFIENEKAGTLMLTGHVEAQNGFGGMSSRRFACSFEKYGATYVPHDRTGAVVFP